MKRVLGGKGGEVKEIDDKGGGRKARETGKRKMGGKREGGKGRERTMSEGQRKRRKRRKGEKQNG